MTKKRPVVLFSMTNGWGIRNFVHTGVFQEIGRFADVAVASSPDLLPYFRELRDQGEIAWTFELPATEHPFWRRVRQAKKAILQGHFDLKTAKIKRMARSRGPLDRIGKEFSWFLQRRLSAAWQIDLLESAEVRFGSPELSGLPEEPSLVINCSPFDPRDNALQRLYHRKRVPTVAIIPSWDNPTTKGCIVTSSKLILAWGDAQKQELLRLYPVFTADKVHLSGIPQFDHYHRPLPEDFERTPFLERLSIDPKARILLYATCSERLFPAEPEVVSDVVKALEQGRFGENAHLLVRCHPADRSARYQHLAKNGKVTVVPSSVEGFKNLYTWIPPSDEIDWLAATLRHSDVCINTASTMTLDAFACKKPVVNVAYDGTKELPYHLSIRRYYDYDHYKPIAQSTAVPIARSAEALLGAIEDALARPERLREPRERVLDFYCHRPPQGSVKYIVSEIERLIR